jgi:hypothetical protein
MCRIMSSTNSDLFLPCFSYSYAFYFFLLPNYCHFQKRRMEEKDIMLSKTIQAFLQM